MLLEIAIGDAYGAGFEFAGKDFIYSHNNLQYTIHPDVLSLSVDQFRMERKVIQPRTAHGTYTDDTQMSIAVAEIIIENRLWTKEILAEGFVKSFKRDPRAGYARGFFNFLSEIKDGHQFLKQIRPDSDKSGAAMRAGCIGIFPTTDEVIEKCTLQASLTHNTKSGIAAANAAALMVHYFLYEKGPKSELGKFINELVPGDWHLPWKGFVSAKGSECVRAAITAIINSDTLSQVLQCCISFSGDVDTVAAIAMGPASCSKELKMDLPGSLVSGLENGPYGCDYILSLDSKLLARVK